MTGGRGGRRRGRCGQGDSFTSDAAIGLHGATRAIPAHARAARRRRRTGVASGHGRPKEPRGPASCTVQLEVRLATIASCTVQLAPTPAPDAGEGGAAESGCTVQLERSPATTPRAAGTPVARGCCGGDRRSQESRRLCQLHGATPGASYHHHELHGATSTNTTHWCLGGEPAESGCTVQPSVGSLGLTLTPGKVSPDT